MAARFAITAFTLELLAAAMYALAAGDSSLTVEPSRLLASGTGGAALIRWGSLIDLAGYLSIAPVVVYLHARYPSARYVDLFAAAGMALVVIGSIGAVVMATAASPMIRDYVVAGGAEREAIRPAFAVLYRAVVVGMWQTLETIPATVWLLGSAYAARRDAARPIVAVLVVAGAINAGIALLRLVAT